MSAPAFVKTDGHLTVGTQEIMQIGHIQTVAKAVHQVHQIIQIQVVGDSFIRNVIGAVAKYMMYIGIQVPGNMTAKTTITRTACVATQNHQDLQTQLHHQVILLPQAHGSLYIRSVTGIQNKYMTCTGTQAQVNTTEEILISKKAHVVM